MSINGPSPKVEAALAKASELARQLGVFAKSLDLGCEVELSVDVKLAPSSVLKDDDPLCQDYHPVDWYYLEKQVNEAGEEVLMTVRELKEEWYEKFNKILEAETKQEEDLAEGD